MPVSRAHLEPIAPDNTEGNRKKNRRVILKLLITRNRLISRITFTVIPSLRIGGSYPDPLLLVLKKAMSIPEMDQTT